jgi:hypothetical protein
MSKSKKSALVALAFVILILALANLACDTEVGEVVETVEEVIEDMQDAAEDLPRVGDGAKIGEALESAVCESQGGRWDDRANVCR